MTYSSAQAKLGTIQKLQTRLSAALDYNGYLGEEFIAKMSMEIETQLQELENLLEQPAECRCG